MCQSNVHPQNHGRPAFTLVEVVLATAILSIILLGMQSAMLAASKAAPDRAGGANTSLQAAHGIDYVAADLAYATAISERTATTIEFTVPDQTGDGVQETIRYSWSGVPGAPLNRTFNGGQPGAVVGKVQTMSFGYDVGAHLNPTTYTQSGEVLLNSYEGAGLLNLGNGELTTSKWVGQRFFPTLPNDATHWAITRVLVKLRRDGASNIAYVQIHRSSGNTPGAMIEQTSLSGLSTSYAWREATFSNVVNLPVGQAACIVLRGNGTDADHPDVQYQSLLASGPNAHLVKSNDGGSSWSVESGQDVIYFVYGKYSTPDAPTQTYRLRGVNCAIQSGSDARHTLRTTIRLLNEPQVSGP